LPEVSGERTGAALCQCRGPGGRSRPLPAWRAYPRPQRQRAGPAARALEHSHLDPGFQTWGNLLLAWAGIVFVTHVVSCILIFAVGKHWLNWLCYAGQFLAMGLVYLRWRPPRVGGRAERQLWGLWLAYVAANFCIPLVTGPLPGFDRPPLCWASYPISELLTGPAFAVLGAGYWGRFYAFTIGFFALAALMPWTLTWASLEFGLLWTAALIAIGLRLRLLGAQSRP
jgi:hypothetical protein